MKICFTQNIQLENGRKLNLETVDAQNYKNEIKACLRNQVFIGISEIFEGEDLLTFRITMNNKVVGFIFLKKAIQTVLFKSGDYILLFVVHPNYRKTGILKACLSNFLRYFMGRIYSIKRYVAIVNDKNVGASILLSENMKKIHSTKISDTYTYYAKDSN